MYKKETRKEMADKKEKNTKSPIAFKLTNRFKNEIYIKNTAKCILKTLCSMFLPGRLPILLVSIVVYQRIL